MGRERWSSLKWLRSCTHCKRAYLNKRRLEDEGNLYCSRECAFAEKRRIAEMRYLVVSQIQSNKRD